MLEGMKGEGYNFADVVGQARERCEKTFTEGAKEALVEGTDWVWEDELELLREEVGSVADQCRKDETKKMINSIEVCVPSTSAFCIRLSYGFGIQQKNFKKQISEPVDLYLTKASPDMWDGVLRTFKETLEKAEATYLSKAKSMSH